MSTAGLLILTEESLTQAASEGRASDVFHGSFGEVARLARAAAEVSSASILIASGKHGLIRDDSRIRPYASSDSDRKVLEGALLAARKHIESHEGILVLALRGELIYALLTGWRASFAGEVFASVGGQFEPAILAAFPRARVTVFRRAGVARLGNAASDAILARLTTRAATK